MRLDASTLGEIYEAEGPALLAFAARRTLDVELAFDIVGETFAVAFARRSRFRGTTREQAVGWLYAICRTQLNRHFRRRGAERRALTRLGVELPVLGDEERRRIEELAGLAELRDQVRSALEQLPEGQRAAVRLRVVDELTYAELSRRLDITPQTARARVSRGLRALGHALTPATESPDAR